MNSSTDATTTELSSHIHRLRKVSSDCGVVADAGTGGGYGSASTSTSRGVGTPSAWSSTATAFEQGRYKLAIKLRELCDNIEELNTLEHRPASVSTSAEEIRLLSCPSRTPVQPSPPSSASPSPYSSCASSQTKKSLIGVEIRRGIKTCKEDLAALRTVAKAEGRKTDYEALKGHIEQTELMYRGRFRSSGGGEAAAAVGIFPVIPDFNETPLLGGTPLLALREDPEFQAHFVTAQQKDEEVDLLVEDITAGVARLGVQSQGIKDEVAVQIVILKESDEKATKTGAELKGVNKKLKRTILDLEKDKMCCYVLCLLLLIIVASALVYVAFFDQASSSEKDN